MLAVAGMVGNPRLRPVDGQTDNGRRIKKQE